MLFVPHIDIKDDVPSSDKTDKKYDASELKLMIDLFQNKYKTSDLKSNGTKTILKATNPFDITVLLTIQHLPNEMASVTLTCNHNDWRGQEIINDNVFDYLKNENCFNPALEETRK